MFDPALGGMLLVSAAKLIPAPTPRDNIETVVRIIFRTFTSMIARWKIAALSYQPLRPEGVPKDLPLCAEGSTRGVDGRSSTAIPLKQGFSSVQQPQNDWPEKRQDCHYSASDISGTITVDYGDRLR